MAPFRWPEARHELPLAKEVAQHNSEKPDDWEAVARRLSKAFSTGSCPAELKGRGCREKMYRVLTNHKTIFNAKTLFSNAQKLSNKITFVEKCLKF